jgi:hypothetical protein
VVRAAGLVRAGGKLVILDVFVAEAGQSTTVEAPFDLMMPVEVPHGRTHRVSEVREWIESAGMAPPTSPAPLWNPARDPRGHLATEVWQQ